MGHGDIAHALISARADVNKIDKWGWTALVGLKMSYGDIAIALIVAGADIDKNNNDGLTALMLASQMGYGDIAKALVLAGADINKADQRGMTALMWASLKGYADIVEALILAGVDIYKADSNGWTAFMLASEKGHERINNILLLKQALNMQNVQYIIQCIKSLFRIFPMGLGILYSSLKDFSFVLNRIEPEEYDDILKKALRYFLRLPQPSGCDRSELDQLITSIRKYDSDVNKSYERQQ